MGNTKRTPHIDIVRRAQALGVQAPWYKLLAVAVVSRAALDWRYLDESEMYLVNLNGFNTSRPELRQFAESEWCETLMQGFEGWTPEFIERAARI